MVTYLEKWISANPKLAVVLGAALGAYGLPYLREALAFIERLIGLASSGG